MSTKISALPSAVTVVSSDLIPIVHDPGGTPITQSATLAQVAALASAGVGWSTALDVDFSLQANQTLGTDTTFTIDGKVWTKFNSTNDQTAMAIVNGQGLVLQPKSTGDYAGATMTVPGIRLPVTIPFGARVRCFMHIAAQNIAANYDNMIMGIDSSSSAASYRVKYGREVSVVGVSSSVQAASSDLGAQDFAVTLGSTTNVVMLDIPRLGHPAVAAFLSAATGSSPYYPADDTFVLGGGKDYAVANMSALTPANRVFFLAGQRAGSGTALSITIARAKVVWRL